MAHRFWLLVADASEATIYGGKSPLANLEMVEKLEHPEGRATERELVTDRPGRRSDEGSGHYSALETNAKEREEKMFVKEIADMLDRRHAEQAFLHLSIIAPPSMLGHLRSKMSARVKRAVLEEVAKTVTNQSIDDVRDHLSRLAPG